MHSAPLLPQAVLMSPGMHWLFLQQPWAQVARLQEDEPPHCPLVQVSPGSHCTQGNPADPQAEELTSLTHSSP